LAQHIKDPQVKAFFLKESQTRDKYANELEFAAALRREESGTAAGAIHRFWGDLKGASRLAPLCIVTNRQSLKTV
jgi:hypothetical protein